MLVENAVGRFLCFLFDCNLGECSRERRAWQRPPRCNKLLVKRKRGNIEVLIM